jgi:DnaK suppressor protein
MADLSDDQIRSQLFNEIANTKLLIEEYREMSGPVAPYVVIGRISRIDAVKNNGLAEAALRQAEERLSQLEYVLARVGKEGFGTCGKCKSKIPLSRILLNPESQFCIRCAQ